MNIKKMAQFIVTSLFAFVCMFIVNMVVVQASNTDWSDTSNYNQIYLNYRGCLNYSGDVYNLDTFNTSDFIAINPFQGIKLTCFDDGTYDVIVCLYDGDYNLCGYKRLTVNRSAFVYPYEMKFRAPYLLEDVEYFRISTNENLGVNCFIYYTFFEHKNFKYSDNGIILRDNWMQGYDGYSTTYTKRDIIVNTDYVYSTFIDVVPLEGRNALTLFNNNCNMALNDCRLIIYDKDEYSIGYIHGININKGDSVDLNLKDATYISGHSLNEAYSFALQIPCNNLIGEFIGYDLRYAGSSGNNNFILDWTYNITLNTESGLEEKSEFFACTTDFIELNLDTYYTVGINDTGISNNLHLFYYDADKNFLRYVELWGDDAKTTEVTFTMPNNARYIRLMSNAENSDDSVQETVCNAIYLYCKNNNQYEEILNGFDNTKYNNANNELDDALSSMDDIGNLSLDKALDGMNEFTVTSDIRTFAEQFLYSFPLVSSMLQSIFVSSGKFGILISVVFTTIISSMVIGLYRYFTK